MAEGLEKDRREMPTGQVLTPVGKQVDLPTMRPQALALSPDGSLLVTAGGPNKALALINLVTGAVTNRALSYVPINSTNRRAVSAEFSTTGLVFSPSGDRIYVSTAGTNVLAFTLSGGQITGPPTVIRVPDAHALAHRGEIPTGLAISTNGRLLYVAGNLTNRLYEIEVETSKVLRYWETGVAPEAVALVGTKIYVSNLGGRRAAKDDRTASAGRGTTVRVDSRDIACEGSVTVIDLAAGTVKCELPVGLHPSALAVSPAGDYLVVANTGSDTLSVIDTKTDQVVEKIWARQSPMDSFGAQPNGLAFDPSGKRLYVCNGTQNALAVVDFKPASKASKIAGLIPVGWFPAAVQFEPKSKTLCVANMKGIGAAKKFAPGEAVKLNTKDYWGTVSLVALPSKKDLAALTEVALKDMYYPRLKAGLLPARSGQKPRPVPERMGEPSVFKHVIYIIKENRTYDQVLGDMTEGNGDTNLCLYKEKVTPNQHKIARDFVLLDNMYCAGVCSTDGHQWTDSAMANEYVERQLSAGNPRSYNNGKVAEGLDSLAWASSGFIWDNALAHGKSFRNYGEWLLSDAGWSDPKRKDKIQWRDFWQSYQNGDNTVSLHAHCGITAMGPFSDTNTVGWDLKVPDVMRAAVFIKELHRFETNGGFPDLVLLFLPNDHTIGVTAGYPKPEAEIADNDLALGQVIEALSKSKFWPETCLFAIEDDPQSGTDHVSGYRTTCYVASPYTRRKQVVSTHYNQLSLMHTMELILGLPPMNQMDATANSMDGCFIDTPDLTPFQSVTNQTSLAQINPDPSTIEDRQLRQDALVSARMNFSEPDRCPDDVLNQILWRAAKGANVPYPAWAVTVVDKD